MVIVGRSLARSSLVLPRDPTPREREVAMTKTSESHAGAVERFQAAREERDRRSHQYDAATGSASELPAFAELKAAEEQFAAREAWLKWVERDY
jgi:hypothetical protein